MRKIAKSVIAAAILFIIVVSIVVFCMFYPFRSHEEVNNIAKQVESFVAEETITNSIDSITKEKSPIDFDGLQKINTDIYSWLYIPNTIVNYPVLQNAEDDEYYINRDYKKNYLFDGCLFTQASYNSKNFDDPVTVIYGHRMRNDSMFGILDNYLDEAFLNTHKNFFIYEPNSQGEYKIFAVVKFDNRNIPYTWNFKNRLHYYDFFDKIYDSRNIGTYLDKTITLSPEENVVILSTCYPGDSTQRLLIMGIKI